MSHWAKPSIPDECFGALQDQYTLDDIILVQVIFKDVRDMAAEYRHNDCTEGHWCSIVVMPLLNLVRQLKRFQKVDSKTAVLP